MTGAGAGADCPLHWDLRARGSVWSTARINSTESPAGKPGRLESVCGTLALKQRPNLNQEVEGRSLEKNGVVQAQTRFVGLDVHRRYATVAAVDTKQQLVLTARRIDFEDFDDWIRKHLRRTDVVTLESSP